jgi:ERCC4-type nuclease
VAEGDISYTKCGFMDDHEISYVVRDLKISEYVFFVGEMLITVFIERKSIEDVASSLHDGRWERQQRNMRKAQHVLVRERNENVIFAI